MKTVLDAVYAGRVQTLPGDSRATAIFKQPVAGAAEVDTEGLLCDAQADRRVHGGPEKAVHHFPAEHYAGFAQRYPDLAQRFAAGSIGENLSTRGLREEDVCIGDVFAAGSVRLQLSQPRSPCWKIDARYGVDGLTQHIDAQGLAGWYYRVLTPGTLQAGDTLQLIEREATPISLRDYWNLKHAHRPSLEAMRQLLASPGLSVQQRGRWQQRFEWLQQQR